jgi:hypothetical protein
MKPRAITLSQWAYWSGKQGPFYRFEKLTDSVEYEIEQILTKAEVAQLCDLMIWKVTVQPAKDIK